MNDPSKKLIDDWSKLSFYCCTDFAEAHIRWHIAHFFVFAFLVLSIVCPFMWCYYAIWLQSLCTLSSWIHV